MSFCGKAIVDCAARGSTYVERASEASVIAAHTAGKRLAQESAASTTAFTSEASRDDAVMRYGRPSTENDSFVYSQNKK